MNQYREKYKIIKHQRDVAKLDDITSIEKYKLEPNSMQVGFIKNLRKIQEAGERKALLISATGTGKTYASAFAHARTGIPESVISSTQESDCEAGAEVISQGIQWTSFDGIGNGKISGI